MVNKICKTFSFNKIDYYSKGRKINTPEVDVELRYNENNQPCLAISGKVWNATHTDIVTGGQCLDELNDHNTLKNNPTFQTLYRLWKNYHLNNFHSGTIKQEKALKAAYADPNYKRNYENDCSYLDKLGLLKDNDYIYGTSFVYYEIPSADIEELNRLLVN